MTEERIKEIENEKLTSWADNGKACIGCIFAYGDTLFDDTPDKGSCAIYQYPSSKPENVYIEGHKCKYYRQSKQNT